MTRRRDAIAVGAWVHVRFLGDGEERDYEMCELELAAMQP